MNMKKIKEKKGFTLAELLVVDSHCRYSSSYQYSCFYSPEDESGHCNQNKAKHPSRKSSSKLQNFTAIQIF